MSEVLKLEYYSDVLCVWAWIAERRNQQLLEECGSKISLDYHIVDVFSDTQQRIGVGWAKKGGYEGFAKHVDESAAPYEDAVIHPDVWNKVRPSTSANAHLVVKAAHAACGAEASGRLLTRIRRAFFQEALDIGKLGVNLELAEGEGLDRKDIQAVIESGRAIAALLSDTKRAHEGRITGSPTWVLNEGRQTLYGNVGYRVLYANVEELLKRPAHEASWC